MSDSALESEEWLEFWKGIVCNTDGTVNLEAVAKELCDFSFVMNQVSKVYDHITGGRLSKCNYYADTVKDAADEHYASLYEEEAQHER